MALTGFIGRLIWAISALVLTVAGADSATSEIPDELIGAWGETDQCLAFHRNPFNFHLDRDGTFVLHVQDGQPPTMACNFQRSSEKNEAIFFIGRCGTNGGEKTSGHHLDISKGSAGLTARFYNDHSPGVVTMRKCDTSDIAKGIGRDTRELKGDLGAAQHILFTMGYAAQAASYCGGRLNEVVSISILRDAREAAHRHAVASRTLPAEAFETRLAEINIQRGTTAAKTDQTILGFCDLIVTAYGPNGQIVSDLLEK